MVDGTPRLAIAVLAAGASQRLGTAKQNVRLAGKTLVRRSLELAAFVANHSGRSETGVHLITGACAVGETDLVGLDVRVHHNPGWAVGRASSLALAADCAAGADGLLVLLCDQYRLVGADLVPMLHAFEARPQQVVAAGYGGIRGAPAIWPARLFDGLSRGRRRGREWLERGDATVVPLAHAAFDLDVPADLEALRRYEESLGRGG